MFKVLLLAAACCVVAVRPSPRPEAYDLQAADQLFEEFVRTYEKQYQNEEEKQMRFQIFQNNLAKINQQNRDSSTATYGINRFSDLTVEEFRVKHTGFNLEAMSNGCKTASDIAGDDVDVPDSFDWRDKGVVTKVKDQGQCGSCWAFSSTGNLEGQYAIKHKKLIEFSEQQLLDCDNFDGACNGGIMEKAFLWLRDNGGIESEGDYPYTARKGQCNFDQSKVVAQVSACTLYSGSSEDNLKKILVSTGPLAIGIDAEGIMNYNGGIVDDCPAGQLNHGVLLVGYGTDNGTPYWLFKNSWGEFYGEKGYFRVKMYRNSCNLTGYIASAVVN